MTLTWEPSLPARKSLAAAGSTSARLVMPDTPLRMLDQYWSGSDAPGRMQPIDTIAMGISVHSSRVGELSAGRESFGEAAMDAAGNSGSEAVDTALAGSEV